MSLVPRSGRKNGEDGAVEEVAIGPLRLAGLLSVPAGAKGIVAFAHGSGSSRLSPRNARVAEALNAWGLGTLLFDLLTEAEAPDRARVFDIPLLAARLGEATDWLAAHEQTKALPLGYFGASTGAAAALVAAAERADRVAAVVGRGGRVDLAGEALARVRAPTLLVIGAFDVDVLELNRAVLERLTCEKALAVVPGAGHLFEEPGTLEVVIDLARNWFARRLGRGGA